MIIYTRKLLLLIATIFTLITLSGCSSFHRIAGTEYGISYEDKDIEIISDYMAGSLQIRVVRHKDSNCISGYQDKIELNGAINKDTSYILERVFRDINQCKTHSGTTYVTQVYMNSDGGSAADGIKIGHLFKKYGVLASITGDHVCASSCGFAFLGARFRNIYHNGKLLFHSPYNNGILGINCANKKESRWLKDYYQEMIGDTKGSLLFNRTMDYCSDRTGWTINSDTARIFGITTR